MTSARQPFLTLVRSRTESSAQAPSADSHPLRGSLNVMSALDVVQWVCTNRQSWVVRLMDQKADASVTIIDGQLVDARWGGLCGEPALTEIVGACQGSFELVPVAKGCVCTLTGDWRVNLLEAVRCHDEREQEISMACQSPVALNVQKVDSSAHVTESPMANGGAPVARSSSQSPSRFEASGNESFPPGVNERAIGLVELGFAAIRAGNHREARCLWALALEGDPSNRTIQLNLRKLDLKLAELGLPCGSEK